MLFRYRVRLPRMQILDRRGAGAVALASTWPAAGTYLDNGWERIKYFGNS